MRFSRPLMFAALSAMGAAGAHAQTQNQPQNYSIAGLAQKKMTYTTVAGASAALSSAYSGVGSLFVTYASTATTGFGSLCTGSLLNSTTVLTAAHCIYDHNESGVADPITSIRFYLPSFGDRNQPGVSVFTASNFQYNPLYDNADHTGDIGSGHDVGMFTLSTAALGFDTYGLYTGDPLKQFTEVGTGTIGGPRGTNQGITSDYLKRTGTNLYELYGDDIFSDVSHGVVLADFDDGTAAHDVFGRNQASFGMTGLNQLGVAGESNSSPGDSGGPEFINGLIASVTSFGITGGIFQNFCGGSSTDPYNSSGTTTVQSLGSCTNSSVGEIAGNTLVSYNLDFINAYIAANTAAVPEPTTWAMMIAGFGLIGAGMRRRRPRVTVAYA